MYVVKVNNFYVSNTVIDVGFVSEITLSREKMRTFSKFQAKFIAELINGEVEEVTNEEYTET